MKKKKKADNLTIDNIEKYIDSLPEREIEKYTDNLPKPKKKLSWRKKRKIQKKTETKPKRNILKKLLRRNILFNIFFYSIILIIVIGFCVASYNIGYYDGVDYQKESNVYKEKLLNIFGNVNKFVYIENNITGFHVWLDIFPWDSTYPVHMDVSWFDVLDKPVRFHTKNR